MALEFNPISDRPEGHRFHDENGGMKRRAARFRVYGFSADGKVVREITSANAKIVWTVLLANKKSAWFEFNGTAKARGQFVYAPGEERRSASRNPGIGAIERDPDTGRRQQRGAETQLFASRDITHIMAVLADPRNGWVVPFQPADSVLVVDLPRPGKPMGAALDRRMSGLFGQVGRMVAYEWIAAGCPLPDEPASDAARTIVNMEPEPRLFVQQYGRSAVH